MREVHVDAKTGREIAPVSAGVVGFVSWRRLAEVFRAAGEIRPSEEPVSFRIEDNGITFFVTSKKIGSRP